jgi:hypothetical protein
MIRTIAARLERLPIERLRDIAYPVTEWMVGIADRLYGDAAEALPRLWDRLIQALVLWDPDRRQACACKTQERPAQQDSAHDQGKHDGRCRALWPRW